MKSEDFIDSPEAKFSFPFFGFDVGLDFVLTGTWPRACQYLSLPSDEDFLSDTIRDYLIHQDVIISFSLTLNI